MSLSSRSVRRRASAPIVLVLAGLVPGCVAPTELEDEVDLDLDVGATEAAVVSSCQATAASFGYPAISHKAYGNQDEHGNWVDPVDLGRLVCTEADCPYPMGVPGDHPGWHRDASGASTSYFPPSADGVVAIDDWLANLELGMPYYLPYSDPAVRMTTGFVYEAGAERHHEGFDYARSDGATFEVRAPADGRVIWVGFMNSPGNTVIIEHTAQSGPLQGQRVRTAFHHLRNGRDHDIRHSVAALDSQWPDARANALYAAQLIAKSSRATYEEEWLRIRWGTNDDTIQVRIGDRVRAGDLIGFAGWTGGDCSGTHLHVQTSIQTNYTPCADDDCRSHRSARPVWVDFDPYGIYARSTSCYSGTEPSGDLSRQRQHPTQYAPFYQHFADVDASRFGRGFSYFAARGFYLQTISSYDRFGLWQATGSFAPRGTGPVRHARTWSQYRDAAEIYGDRGYRPRFLTGAGTAVGPLFSAIFERGDVVQSSHQMTESQFNRDFSRLYGTSRLIDAEPFVSAGQLYFTATWEPRGSGGGTAFYYRRTEAEIRAIDRDKVAAGMRMVRLYAYDHPGLGRRYAALWAPANGAPRTYAFFTLSTPSTFEAFARAYERVGWRVMHTSSDGDVVTLLVEASL